MSKTTASTAVILALLTGLVLGQLGSLAWQPVAFQIPGSVTASSGLETARAFYADLNLLLANGDRIIASTVMPGFLDHETDEQRDRTLPELIDSLLDLRAIWPHLRVTVQSLDRRAALIVAQLSIAPGVPGEMLDIPLAAAAPMQIIEYLQVGGAGITDRWSAGFDLPVATFSLRADLPKMSASSTMPALMRVALPPGRATQLPLDGPAILHVESGSVQVDEGGNDGDGDPHSASEPVHAGEVRILDSAVPVMVHNFSNDAAELWVFTSNLRVGGQMATDATAESDDPRPRIAAFIPLMYDDANGISQRVSMSQATLPPGTTVQPHEAGVMEEVVVLDGAIEVTVDRGRILPCIDGASARPVDDSISVGAGSGISAKGATSFGYRVAGGRPATVLVVRIDAPAESGGEAPA